MVAFVVEHARGQVLLDRPPFHEWTLPDGTVCSRIYRTRSGYLLRFQGLADYAVSIDGREVRCYPAPEALHERIHQLYLNQVMPLAMSRQGKLVFHASSVEVDGRAVVFVGASGRGKSTLAASFATNGCGFLTDDGLVVDERAEGFCVQPSHPSIRLWADSQERLAHLATPALPSPPYTAKVRIPAGGNIAYCSRPRRLHRVYFLGDCQPPHATFTRLGPGDALVELVRHSFLLDVQATDLIASHFDQLVRLIGQTICYRVDYPRRFEALGDVRNAITQHCGL